MSLALGLSALAPSSRGQAPTWPSRPLRLVAGGPGSVTDIRARWLAERLSEALGQAVVVGQARTVRASCPASPCTQPCPVAKGPA